MIDTTLDRLILRFVFATFALFPATLLAHAPKLEPLSPEHCVDMALQVESEMDPRNQRYWYPRAPPFIGFKKGERLGAGGDGTCLIGFPKATVNAARVSIDGQVVDLAPDTLQSVPHSKQIYTSEDRSIRLVITETGTESTCERGGESCCGIYTYATISLTRSGKTVSVKAVRYVGS